MQVAELSRGGRDEDFRRHAAPAPDAKQVLIGAEDGELRVLRRLVPPSVGDQARDFEAPVAMRVDEGCRVRDLVPRRRRPARVAARRRPSAAPRTMRRKPTTLTKSSSRKATMTGRLMKVCRAVKMKAISRRPAIGDRAEDDRRLAVQRASLPPVQAEGIEHQRPHEQDARQDGQVPRKRRQRRRTGTGCCRRGSRRAACRRAPATAPSPAHR